MIYITASGSQTIATAANAIIVQVNTTLSGTLTLAAGGVTFAVITNPTMGTAYKYGGLFGQGAITINPSASTDVTVSFVDRVS